MALIRFTHESQLSPFNGWARSCERAGRNATPRRNGAGRHEPLASEASQDSGAAERYWRLGSLQ